MAAIIEAETQWHKGEEEMHSLLRVPQHENPTTPYLSPYAARLLVMSPLLAIGTLDAEDRPWTTIWGGEAGFSQPVAQSVIGVKATVDRRYDPVLQTLLGNKADGEIVREEGAGRMVSGLATDLESRNRVKLAGRMIAGALSATEAAVGEVQLVVKIEQSLGNCPKYMNKKHIYPHMPHPTLVSDSLILPKAALDLIEKADLFFISSSNYELDMDTNHRGGPQGFVRVMSNDESGLTLLYPEYSGNRLYQTLGNLRTTPRAGITFPDFDAGDVLYITGTTEVLAGKDASNLIAHTNLAVKIKVDAVRFVSDGLGFRGREGERSPYNPPVRFLSSESKNAVTRNNKQVMAKLISKHLITPTIGRFRFQITDPEQASKWKPGEYVALSFADELDTGYSHMRDDDPKSLNDDFLRTFTVSSRQNVLDGHDQFEITIRKVGPVTSFLFKHNPRTELSVPLQGFGGQFFIQQGEGEKISFIAGGVGITPLLAQVYHLDLKRLNFYWTLRANDLAFANDVFERVSGLADSTKLFITGKNPQITDAWKRLTTSGASLELRRIQKDDIVSDLADRWYMCTGPGLKKSVLEWMGGKPVIYEDFNY